ncbi:methyltransferase [Marinomonas piezotolerans]|uniref:Methyltransferase n=1 Tax=Marinomonas piezotolerans TaxID=2213058 RepID=A0A370U7L3_9GAMM|nr:methyltransferase [Marinomonas piezotolerans]RDL43764.1 methyltransferase [Marinomonas piezotolerans]
MSILEKPIISDCGRFHIEADGSPLYTPRFDEVLAFHKVGKRWIAPVKLGAEAFHIDTDGLPIYGQRFYRCFGFYNDLAAVVGEDGWYHIDESGSALYSQRYEFSGNYQEKVCVVMDSDGLYFHLNVIGEPVYDSRWRYCGDFRDGVAVVQAGNGLSTHILPDGSLLHDIWFSDLDVFHKGYARAKTLQGWCHVDKQGNAIYSERYASVEPFYNGFARCETDDGALLIIDESGHVARQLREPTSDTFSELSAEMVGYWKTYTIYTSVKLGVFERLPASIEQLSLSCQCKSQRLKRLMRGLTELGLVYLKGNRYVVSNKGSYLCLSHEKTLVDASIEYGEDLLQRWKSLPELIQGKRQESDIFSVVATNPERVRSHHRMLASYALHDYSAALPLLPIEPGQRVLDAAGGTGTLATLLQDHFPDTRIFLGDLAPVIAQSSFPAKFVMDLFSEWPGVYDVIVLARVLHDWADTDAISILHNSKQALSPNGEIYLLEMLLSENESSGALCDLHLLSVTGGQERTLSELGVLACQAELQIKQVIELPSLVSLVILKGIENHA